MSAPTCRTCGKKLRKHTYLHEYATVSAIPAVGTEAPRVQGRSDTVAVVRGVTSRKELGWRATWVVHLWFGEYGGYGDDRFCGLTCGWRWACRNCQ